MTLEEFSNEFDLMVNSILSLPQVSGYIIPPTGFNEYEKSVFLTNAQLQLVLTYYNGRNDGGLSFEVNEEARRYLDELVVTETITDYTKGGLTAKSRIYNKPEGLWFITYEQGTLDDKCKTIIPVVPVTQDEFYNTQNNPFKTTNRILRLDCGNGKLELVGDKSYTYTIRYIKKLKPIILTDLGDLTINDETGPMNCQLNDVLHRDILRVAVALALLSLQPQLRQRKDSKES